MQATRIWVFLQHARWNLRVTAIATDVTVKVKKVPVGGLQWDIADPHFRAGMRIVARGRVNPARGPLARGLD